MTGRKYVYAGPMVGILAAALWLSPPTLAEAKTPVNQMGRATKAQIERGRYLVSLAACSDCHTPMKIDPVTHAPAPDMARMLSGHPETAGAPKTKLAEGDMAVIGGTMTAFAQPFGTVYSANITPDRDTGIGTWSEAMFIKAMRTGKHLGQGRPILPPMPWYGLAGLTDSDLQAVFAYLRSVPAVRNAVPDSKVSDAVLANMEMENQEIAKHLDIPAKKRSSP